MTLGDLVRLIVERAGFVVHRWPTHRFEAMEDALRLLQRNGYRPRIVIDCGANRAQWFGLASAIFPDSEFHLIEPQAECWPALDRASAARGRTEVHRTAVTAPGSSAVRMHRGSDSDTTGAFVIGESESFPVDVHAPAATLDALFAERVGPDDRALLKLDIEGHELEALRGASSLLDRVEVIVSEVRFFDVNGARRPVFSEVLAFLEGRNFALFDFAVLGGRRRDQRLRAGDAIFIRQDSVLGRDVAWD